jgi:hypothetical protein
VAHNAHNDCFSEPSPAAQRAFDALIEGRPVPDEALARLGDDERAELVGLASTALLTRTAIEGAAPPRKEAEAASLQRAQERVATAEPRKSSGGGATGPANPGWLARWRDRRRGNKRGTDV